MKTWWLIGALLFPFGMFGVKDRPGTILTRVEVGGQSVVIKAATEASLPPVPTSDEGFDCNNALFWDGGTLYAFSSHEHPYRSSGPDLENLERPSTRVSFDNEEGWENGGRWIEAVHKVPGGRLYMWYHHEPKGLFGGWLGGLTAPRVGQMVSDDNGLHWRDQGTVIEAPQDSQIEESTFNRYFGGGYGDFSVIADTNSEYLYFFISSYHKDPARQGVAVARMKLADLDEPEGKVFFWREGRWEEPGLGGEPTPVFPAQADWHAEGASAYWGPSVHWNTAIKKYVLLMNKTKNGNWDQDGVHLAIAPRLDDPSSWSAPKKILDTDKWYPQVIGVSRGARETDRLADQTARLFVKGKSTWTIEFQAQAAIPAPAPAG
ncbi:MAG: hypothetical protein AB7I30_18235 [Isosphaeraceae bacterium]